MIGLLSPGARHVLEALAHAKVLLAFDFDGTLAPIVPERDEAVMRPRTAALLRRVCALYPTAVVSGRARADVERRVAGLGLRWIVGSHGIDPGRHAARFRRSIAAARPLLEAALVGVDGVELEDKELSLSIHYRRARHKQRARLAIAAALAKLPEPLRAIPGKLVVSVLPADAPDKGDAVRELRGRAGADTALFLGDDVTDEDVFRLDEPGRLLSVRVGASRASAAAWFVQSQRAVDSLLARLISLRSHAPP